MFDKNSGFLVANNIHKDFGHGSKINHVLKGVSVEFRKNATYAIKGVSGSGKSTLMHILGGLDKPTKGTIAFNETDIYKLSNRKKENIMLIGLVRGETKKTCANRGLELLEVMGMKGKEDNYPGQLSGGEQQRVSVARAIFNKPSFLLADEPTGNLDSDNAQNVVDLILKARDEWGMGIIICSHDPNIYNKMDTTYSLQDGLLTK